MKTNTYTRLDRKHDKALLNALYARNNRRANYWEGQRARYAARLKRAGSFAAELGK